MHKETKINNYDNFSEKFLNISTNLSSIVIDKIIKYCLVILKVNAKNLSSQRGWKERKSFFADFCELTVPSIVKNASFEEGGGVCAWIEPK